MYVNSKADVNTIYYVLELVCNSIFPYPEPSITAHIDELLLPIAWAGQNQPMKFEQTAHYMTEHMPCEHY